MGPIGGFFELELPSEKQEYHEPAYRFNLARAALAGHLISAGCEKVYLPAYCCSSLSDTLRSLGVKFSFYNVGLDLNPLSDIQPKENESFLYVNYFGVKGDVVAELEGVYGERLIVDNSQSFFSPPPELGAAIYSARKFFGVPDGAYLYSDRFEPSRVKLEKAEYSAEHLIQRVEYGPEEAYPRYRESEKKLRESGLREMSGFSRRLLAACNYREVAQKRLANFSTLHSGLKALNLLQNVSFDGILDGSSAIVPMVYPLLVKEGEAIRNQLIKNRVYVAKYWQDVVDNEMSSGIEKELVQNLIPLPIDQRYSTEHMLFIIDVINKVEYE